ncbi:23S rRNA (pseudouridine(1915)-N(3))-methyltransferase RlmH [Acholeplasma sp. OttesenSCG-928-E16]|nr:23S rRNA (pseudouridine(1915)-N(3))-methyltransferase RlmH [Acholeplasma sp. OttesenSCG-928-E16]
MIKIISVGKIKKDYLNEGIKHYQKQISFKIEFIEIDDEKDINGINIEGKKILEKVNDKDFLVALAINGVMLSSEEFSNKLDLWLSSNNNITFVIGGSYGLSEEVYKRANYLLSFSKMTFPHQLMRLFLVEQIYRGLMIKINHPYHK